MEGVVNLIGRMPDGLPETENHKHGQYLLRPTDLLPGFIYGQCGRTLILSNIVENRPLVMRSKNSKQKSTSCFFPSQVSQQEYLWLTVQFHTEGHNNPSGLALGLAATSSALSSSEDGMERSGS